MPRSFPEAQFLNRHLFQCMIRGNKRSCKILDLYLAVTGIHARLEQELEEFKIRPPLGPDPVPEDVTLGLLDGDPDGNPSVYFPVTGGDLKERIRTATELQGALAKIGKELEANIAMLKAADQKMAATAAR